MATKRLTMAQALILYLTRQYVSRDGKENRFFAGVWGIFGHGIVAGLGQALQQYATEIRYYQSRNEQAQVHAAIAFAKQKNRLQTFACTSSIGPGATNMITGTATATVNRIPVLPLPGDIFAERLQSPVLQQLESEYTQDIGVNNCFKPVSRYWDRLYRPEQLITALPEAMRVLASPADTGAVTLALPQDVVLCAAGSLPGDLHKLWRTRDPRGYHLEYGYSCMGYEIAGGMGAAMAAPDRDVYVMVGDGSYLMMNSEIVTMLQEHIKVVIVLLDKHGSASIGGLSKHVGSDGFGTKYRFPTDSSHLDGETLPIDYAQNCASLGAHVIRATTREAVTNALEEARQIKGKPVCIVTEVDRRQRVSDYESWWDVAVAEVSERPEVRQARAQYEEAKKRERYFV
jgi:TPP-dependent trihydroxycyclohexane-1,2-dione (THcHDO) dehydratase